MLSLVVAVGFLVAIPAGSASAATTVLDATDTGWWLDTGLHQSANPNYFVGELDNGEHNNYFTFDLSAGLPCPAIITGATLSAPNPVGAPSRELDIHAGSGSPRTYTLYDVSTSAGALDANDLGSPAGIAIYNDLGSGTVFGSMTPATVNDNPIVVPFNAAGVAALNAALGGSFSVGGALTGAVLDDFLFGLPDGFPVTLTLTTEDPFLQPDAQIKGGPASLTYLGDDIYNESGLGQTYQRTVRPGFGDQFNVKIENDSNCFTDSFHVEGQPGTTRFKVSYWYEGADVTFDVVNGLFQTPDLKPGASVDLMVFIYAKRGTRSGTSITDLITATSAGSTCRGPCRGETAPVASDRVIAKLVVNKKAGDFNSQLPIP